MTELGELILILAGLHAALGVHWFPRSAYVFRALVGTKTRVIPASIAWGSDRMALSFGPPLPGTGRFHLVDLFPLSLAREAVYAHVAQDPNPGGRTPKSGRVVTWDAARDAHAESRDVFVGSTLLVAVGSEALARHIARELRKLSVLDDDRRAVAIEALRVRSLDESLVRERADVWARESVRLRWPALATAVMLFVVLPIVWVTVGVSLAWPWLLGAVIALQAWSASAFRRAHLRLNPTERRERVARTLAVALSPLEALRTSEILGRDLFAEFHPFAVGAVLLPRADFELLAERLLRDARNPMPPACPSEDPRAIAAEGEARAGLVRVLTEAAQRQGFPMEFARTPPTADADEATYCPRCVRTYTLAAGTCTECWDLPLVAFGRRTST